MVTKYTYRFPPSTWALQRGKGLAGKLYFIWGSFSIPGVPLTPLMRKTRRPNVQMIIVTLVNPVGEYRRWLIMQRIRNTCSISQSLIYPFLCIVLSRDAVYRLIALNEHSGDKANNIEGLAGQFPCNITQVEMLVVFSWHVAMISFDWTFIPIHVLARTHWSLPNKQTCTPKWAPTFRDGLKGVVGMTFTASV